MIMHQSDSGEIFFSNDGTNKRNKNPALHLAKFKCGLFFVGQVKSRSALHVFNESFELRLFRSIKVDEVSL